MRSKKSKKSMTDDSIKIKRPELDVLVDDIVESNKIKIKEALENIKEAKQETQI